MLKFSLIYSIESILFSRISFLVHLYLIIMLLRNFSLASKKLLTFLTSLMEYLMII